MLNSFNVFVSRRRWLKRILNKFLSQEAHIYLKSAKLTLFYNPKDLRGPSFHVAYDLDKGFNNYEFVEKNEIVNHLPQNGLFVDVGANIGLFSLYVLSKRKDIQIDAYEPDPQIYQLLKKTQDRNQLTNLNLFPQAIGNQEGTIKLFKSKLNDGGHSTILNDEEKDAQNFVSVKIGPLIRNKKVDVIKIDVEGAEIEVLKGALNIIQKDRPMLIVETSNIKLAEKAGIYEFFSTHFDSTLKVRVPGEKHAMNLEELPQLAKTRLNQGKEYNNYIFEF